MSAHYLVPVLIDKVGHILRSVISKVFVDKVLLCLLLKRMTGVMSSYTEVQWVHTLKITVFNFYTLSSKHA